MKGGLAVWPTGSTETSSGPAKLYATLAKEGGAQSLPPERQTRADLDDLIGLTDFESLDAAIVATVLPTLATGPANP